MIKVSIVDRIPHTRFNGVARYMLGITGLKKTGTAGVDLRVLYWGRQQKAKHWNKSFKPRNFHSKFNQVNRRFLRPLGQRLYHPDVVHYPYHYLPVDWAVGPGKKIVTVHGASAFSQELFDPERGESIKRALHEGLSNLNRIVTVSEWSKAELVTHFDLPEELISVIPNGVDVQHFSPKNALETSALLGQQFGLTSPYLLHLGPAQPRKNIIRTIQAFGHLKTILKKQIPQDKRLSELKLVLSGLPGQDTKRAQILCKDLNLQHDVIWLGKIDDQHLPYLYSGAELFVFPSLYEGFGIPLLESMACNTPVVASNTSAIPEVVGDAATLIDPLNHTDIANACYQLLSDKKRYQSMQQKGLLRSQMYTWERCAERHMALYRDVASS